MKFNELQQEISEQVIQAFKERLDEIEVENAGKPKRYTKKKLIEMIVEQDQDYNVYTDKFDRLCWEYIYE